MPAPRDELDPPPPRSADRMVALLRVGAVVEMLAFPWVVVPRTWMERSHEWLGMGAMPMGAVVDFTIRQSAFFYGMHGVLMWWLARDVVRFQPLVRLMGWTYLAFGPVFFLINAASGTPTWWTVCDPLVTGLFGGIVLVLDRNLTRETAQSVPAVLSVAETSKPSEPVQNSAPP